MNHFKVIMMGKCLIFLLISLLGISVSSSAQVQLSDEVKSLMEEMQLDYLQPVERFYKSIPVEKNIYLDYHMAVEAPDVNLEIRYVFRPVGYHFYDGYPNVHAMSAVSSVATNNQDEEMVLKPLSEKVAREVYHADWAAVVDFVPKFQFSELPNGRMLALYSEGKGSVFIFFLYDVPSRFLEDQIVNVRFR